MIARSESHRATQPLVEDVLPDHTIATMKQYETRRSPEGLFRSAWNYVEYALNRSVEADDTVRSCYFDYANDLLGAVMCDSKAAELTRLEGLVLSTYIPVMRKRAFHQEMTQQDCHDIYTSIGRAIHHIRPIDTHEPPDWRLSETMILAASARTVQPQLLMYPASPREEASDDAMFNHDGYFVLDGKKLPIQHKYTPTDHYYDAWITTLEIKPIFMRVFAKNNVPLPEKHCDQLNYILSLIVAETYNGKLDRGEKATLDCLSEAVINHYQRAKFCVAA